MLQENFLKEALRLNRRLPDLCWRIMCTIVNGEFSDLRCLMKTLNNNNNNSNNNNNNNNNHNYNKIVKSDWLSTALISALIGQFNRTVRIMPK